MEISLKAEKLFEIGDFAITNTLLMSWLIVLLLIAISTIIYKRKNIIPQKLQSVFELIVEYAFDLTKEIIGDEKQAKKYFSFIMTIFFFVLFANWLEVLPGMNSIGIYGDHNGKMSLIPFLRSPSTDLNFTLALAMIAFLFLQVAGIIAMGFKNYSGKFLNFKSGMGFVVGMLDIISEFAKIISFSFRLFGNIFAGEVLLIVISGFLSLIGPLPFLFLEFFVGIIQAFVFAILTTVFVKIATTEHH